jgi:hypothetical protein
MKIFCENFCKVLPCFDIVFNSGKADNICKIQGVLKIPKCFVFHLYPFDSEWRPAALVSFPAASPTATNQVFAWIKAKPSLPLTPRLEDGWEMKVQFHAFQTSALKGPRLSAAQSGQYITKERGSAIHWGSTCPWATREGFQMRKVLALAGNWTQTFLSFCLSLWRLNNASPSPSHPKQKHRVERFFDVSNLRFSQQYCGRL